MRKMKGMGDVGIVSPKLDGTERSQVYVYLQIMAVLLIQSRRDGNLSQRE